MGAPATTGDVRIAELVATLSYVADLGLGEPMEHCMRQTVLALRIADVVGVTPKEREATYYLGMLVNAHCHADASEQAQWFGDDRFFKSNGFEILGLNTAQMIGRLIRHLTSHGTTAEKAKRVANFPIAGYKQMMSFLETHTTLGAQFADRLGFDDLVSQAISQAYEYWDGKGQPNRLSGEQICLPARIVSLASPVETFTRRHGVASAVAMAKKNRGAEFDPSLVDVLSAHANELLAGLDDAGTWDAVLAAEPGVGRRVPSADLDEVLKAMGDLVDLKSPYLAGHSRGVAHLAAEAGRVAGFSEDDVIALRRAGYIHDLGRMGVSNAVWDKASSLTDTEFEKVRLHPYLTDRMLARVSALSRPREIAARHHERLDGSGYPRGLTAASLTPPDRLLAAADVYHAMTEPRPHRPAHHPDRIARELRDQVRAGLLDGDAVNAVLIAAGHRAPARREWPGGLTAREVEVLQLLARGHANKQIAQRLDVSAKTVSNHIEHIYAKLGVSSRAAATLFATRAGLMGNYESA